jgi:hypothetical protein
MELVSWCYIYLTGVNVFFLYNLTSLTHDNIFVPSYGLAVASDVDCS